MLKHLNALTDAGLLDRERSGREVRYRVTPAPLSDAVSWMADGRRAVGRPACGALSSAAGRPAGARAVTQRGEIPKYGTAQPTIFWNAGAATEPP